MKLFCQIKKKSVRHHTKMERSTLNLFLLFSRTHSTKHSLLRQLNNGGQNILHPRHHTTKNIPRDE